MLLYRTAAGFLYVGRGEAKSWRTKSANSWAWERIAAALPEQADAEVPFQGAHLLPHGRLGHFQGAGGRSEGLLPDALAESPRLPQMQLLVPMRRGSA